MFYRNSLFIIKIKEKEQIIAPFRAGGIAPFSAGVKKRARIEIQPCFNPIFYEKPYA
jgi:hypothetical protein